MSVGLLLTIAATVLRVTMACYAWLRGFLRSFDSAFVTRVARIALERHKSLQILKIRGVWSDTVVGDHFVYGVSARAGPEGQNRAPLIRLSNNASRSPAEKRIAL